MIYKDAWNIRPGKIKAFILSPHHPTPPAGVSLHGWMQASREIYYEWIVSANMGNGCFSQRVVSGVRVENNGQNTSGWNCLCTFLIAAVSVALFCICWNIIQNLFGHFINQRMSIIISIHSISWLKNDDESRRLMSIKCVDCVLAINQIYLFYRSNGRG